MRNWGTNVHLVHEHLEHVDIPPVETHQTVQHFVHVHLEHDDIPPVETHQTVQQVTPYNSIVLLSLYL